MFDSRLGEVYDIRTGNGYTTEELRGEIARRKRSFEENNIGAGDKIIILHGDSIHFFADLLALWSLGSFVAVINPNLTKPELDNIFESFNPAFELCGDGISDYPRIRAVSKGQRTASQIIKLNTVMMARVFTMDSPALVLYTSGSAGKPKGVVHTYRGLMFRFYVNKSMMSSEPPKVTLCTLPTHFGHGLLGNALSTLFLGTKLLIGVHGNTQHLMSMGQLIDDYGVDFLSSVPSLWRMVTKTQPPKKNTLKRVHVGSAPLGIDLWSDIIKWTGTANVWNMYGLTETANWVSGASSTDGIPENGFVGSTWGAEFGVLNRRTGLIEETGEGEVLVRSGGMMAGYLSADGLDREAFIGNWFVTGDVGYLDNSGLRLIGRTRFEIYKGGVKISPEEIEILIEAHPCVRDACAFSVDNAIAGEVIGIAIVLAKQVSVPKLIEWASKRVVKEKIPDKWFFVSEIPKNDSGKIDRIKIKEVLTMSPSESRKKNE